MAVPNRRGSAFSGSSAMALSCMWRRRYGTHCACTGKTSTRWWLFHYSLLCYSFNLKKNCMDHECYGDGKHGVIWTPVKRNLTSEKNEQHIYLRGPSSSITEVSNQKFSSFGAWLTYSWSTSRPIFLLTGKNVFCVWEGLHYLLSLTPFAYLAQNFQKVSF